jgi:hypothetical protein
MVSIISFYEGEENPHKSILNEVKLVYPNVLIFQIQTNGNPTLTELYDIKTKPTMIFLSGSSEHNRCEGETSRDDIFNILGELFEDDYQDGEWH